MCRFEAIFYSEVLEIIYEVLKSINPLKWHTHFLLQFIKSLIYFHCIRTNLRWLQITVNRMSDWCPPWTHNINWRQHMQKRSHWKYFDIKSRFVTFTKQSWLALNAIFLMQSFKCRRQHAHWKSSGFKSKLFT